MYTQHQNVIREKQIKIALFLERLSLVIDFSYSKDSALAMKSKLNILSADLLRVMRNVSPLCTEEERTNHVQHFVQRMQYSVYSVQERIEVHTCARQKYQTIVKNDKDGVIP